MSRASFTKSDVVSEGIGSIHYGEIYTSRNVGDEGGLTCAFRDGSRACVAATGDVVIAAVGETVEDVLQAVAWLGDEDVAVHDDCFIFRHFRESEVRLATTSRPARSVTEKAKHVATAKVKRVSSEGLPELEDPGAAAR